MKVNAYEIAVDMKGILQKHMEEDISIESLANAAKEIQYKHGERIAEMFFNIVDIEGWVRLT